MKKCRFLWSAHRITERQKAGKSRSIKGKQLKNSRSTVSQSTLSTTDALHGLLLIRQRFGKLKIIMTVVLLKVQMSIRLRKARRRLLILMRSSVILTDFMQLRRTSLTTMRPALPKELRSQEKQCLSALIARLHTLFIRL